MKKISIFIISCLFILVLSPHSAYSERSTNNIPRLVIFHSLSCHNCIEVKHEIMPLLEKRFKGRIDIEYRDIADIENYKLLLSLEEKYKVKLSNDLPIFYCSGKFLSGEKEIKDNWQAFMGEALRISEKEKVQELPRVDLVARFRAFKLFTIISVGLVDGINPCAFTVIVFFISFLALQGYIKKELIAIGLTFIFAVFATYFLMGLGAFSFLYRIGQFWLIAKLLNFSIGIFSIILGGLALYDFFKFKKTGQTEGLALQLPQAVKNQIHKVVGLHYRVDKKIEVISSRRRIFRLIISALITGFLVSILEAICTGQTYLPTITFILKTTHLKWHALAYLLIYNFMFVVPLFIIFIFALFGVSSEQFSKILKKHLLTIKILMALLFFGLGVFLIWRA